MGAGSSLLLGRGIHASAAYCGLGTATGLLRIVEAIRLRNELADAEKFFGSAFRDPDSATAFSVGGRSDVATHGDKAASSGLQSRHRTKESH